MAHSLHKRATCRSGSADASTNGQPVSTSHAAKAGHFRRFGVEKDA
ncbi:hypothetical protein L485_23235 [Sphingobium baderi LL03]|uniref:Uncharacterized protein n=1 Tax=Sphingobium baderi LL03 TaxID=1114964 RepID=T0GAE5_9SPHN|nr:hypothetical protein L485_23235 [Sphingobium baderi LL03]